MEKAMMAFCGADCGVCEWKDQVNCKGCRASAGKMFWGECDKAKCCMERNLEHCGHCPELPCQMLTDLFNDAEHGDDGARLRNLKNWAAGKNESEKLGNLSQAQAKENRAER